MVFFYLFIIKTLFFFWQSHISAHENLTHPLPRPCPVPPQPQERPETNIYRCCQGLGGQGTPPCPSVADLRGSHLLLSPQE